MTIWSQRVLLAGAAMSWAVAACTVLVPSSPPVATPPPAPIKIGVLADVTGVTSIEGTEMRISTDLVIQQTNASGGINGHPIEAVYVDPRTDPSQAIQLATQVVDRDKR